MHPYDQDIAVVEETPGVFSGRVTNGWSIANVPNGGYILSLVANMASSSTEKRGTPILTANYVYRGQPGPFRGEVEKIAGSRQYDRFQVRLAQEGAERVRAFCTFREQNGLCAERRYEQDPPVLAPVEECVAIPRMPGFTLYDNVEVRLDPSCAGWMLGSPAAVSESKGWFSFLEQRPPDLFSVILAADAFPPAIMASQGILPWVPTIELSVSIRNLPETRWLAGRFRTRYVDCGILEEDGEVWDANGRLCAVSRQIAQVRGQA
ncbi:MAG: thioesterase family protein [Thermodesulfobacteriota bacterium]